MTACVVFSLKVTEALLRNILEEARGGRKVTAADK
jgi:hypothetical protein